MGTKELGTKFKDFTKECRRVLKVTKKPSNDEFKVIVKASAIGMAAIGAIGFLVQLFKELII